MAPSQTVPLGREHVRKYLEEVRTEAMWVSEGKAFQAMVRQAGACGWSRMSEGSREDEVKGVLFGA